MISSELFDSSDVQLAARELAATLERALGRRYIYIIESSV
jgi:hypothetical protein